MGYCGNTNPRFSMMKLWSQYFQIQYGMRKQCEEACLHVKFYWHVQIKAII